MAYRKKLIEVALPLEPINTESLRRKQKAPKGYPTSFHKWWAQRPLAAARAVIFAQLVDDPSEYVEELLNDTSKRSSAEKAFRLKLKDWEKRKATYEKAQIAGMDSRYNPDPGTQPTLEDTIIELERHRLFGVIEQLVLWENSNNENVLRIARDEIGKSWRRTCTANSEHLQAKELFDPERLPTFYDPFTGSGVLPLEAQRLGLEAHASDLNPVAVLINKAMIEIPPKFAGKPPINPQAKQNLELFDRKWLGAQGLSTDIRYYSQWMRDEADKRVGHFYPKVEITKEMARERPDLGTYVGKKLTVIAYLWARSVKSPNPAFTHIEVPLTTTFVLSSKADKEVYVEPIINNNGFAFKVKLGKPKDPKAIKNGTKLARGANFSCLMSGAPIESDYIKTEGKAGRMGHLLMAVVAEGDKGRVYLSPTTEMDAVARQAQPSWKPDTQLADDPRALWTPPYGLTTFGDLFTPRQLVALTTFSDLIQEVRERIVMDANSSDLLNDDKPLADGGVGVRAYADAVCTYLAIVLDRMAYYGSSLSTWLPKDNALRDCMPRQGLAMAWDFAEGNPLGKSSVDITTCTNAVCNYLDISFSKNVAVVTQADARLFKGEGKKGIISTDPPYYDNVGYAILSDYFYVWLRRSLQTIYPELFKTLAVPKSDELVASPYRHGSKAEAKTFFLSGMTQTMGQLAKYGHPDFPITIYYAFNQDETDDEAGTASTGWETFLEAIINSGLNIRGTWPMRTEGASRMVARGTNALASSIVLVCRPSVPSASSIARRDFISALKAELPVALAELQRSNIAPVDLAQAAIGPGMAIYTRYSKVLDAQGKSLSVRQALALINQVLDETLAEQESDFDADTRWALAWFEQTGFNDSDYGLAETLSKAKDTSVSGMMSAGILSSGRGKVRLLKPAELPDDWDPSTDSRLTVWEMVHHLVRVLEADGENAAAEIVAKLGSQAETARELCYRLYTICERKKRSAEALSYNGLVQSWPEITRLAREGYTPTETQPPLL